MAGIGTVVITQTFAFASTVVCHLGGGLADNTIERGIVLHEMCCRQTHLSTVEQYIVVLIRSVFATCLPARVSCTLTDCVTVKAILNTLLNLNLNHWLFVISLHCLFFLPFYSTYSSASAFGRMFDVSMADPILSVVVWDG